MTNVSSPSATALTAAAARAAHLVVDRAPFLFADPLAHRLLGEQADTLLGYHRAHGSHPVLAGARTAVVTRARYTEDRLAESTRRGVAQYVILGAGLDTSAYRPDAPRGTRVFEVDRPATQEWKRLRLAEEGITAPGTVTFVPVDLERDSLPGRLAAHGFDPSAPAFVAWLGVSMYLTREAVGATLDAVRAFAPGTELVMDYLLPEELRDADGQAYAEAVMGMAARNGEPWLSFFAPADLTSLLGRHGLEVVEHVGQRECVAPELWERSDALRPSRLACLTRARVAPPSRTVDSTG